ncbi:TPA: ead/Ea22-like family protein [Klebsiella pneumoniae]
MTDITALAQSLKAAAEKAKHAGEAPIMSFDARISALNEYQITACPDNVLALVEVLENANRYIERLREWNAGLAQESCERQQLISELEPIRAAAEKLVRCKGRYHSEQNYRALAALFGVKTPDLPPLEHENVHYADAAEMEIEALRQRIAELESRTVKLPKLKMLEDYLAEVAIEERKQILVGVKLEFHRALAAAGIKVEAE